MVTPRAGLTLWAIPWAPGLPGNSAPPSPRSSTAWSWAPYAVSFGGLVVFVTLKGGHVGDAGGLEVEVGFVGLAGERDRALIALMGYTFARIGAVVGMKVPSVPT